MTKAVIETFTGESFAPLEPDPRLINLADIAHALSNQCRFSGHTGRHYSVAEHSIHVSYLIERSAEPQHALWGLLHDASEAYLIDLPTPLKLSPTLGPAYLEHEKRLMGAVCERFSLQREQPSIVTWADRVMLVTEIRDLMCNPMHAHWLAIKTEKPRDEPLSLMRVEPVKVRNQFIQRFYELGGT